MREYKDEEEDDEDEEEARRKASVGGFALLFSFMLNIFQRTAVCAIVYMPNSIIA